MSANISEIKRTFDKLDKNKDNRLSAEEFVRGGKMIGLKLTLKEAQKMVDEVDEDGSGYIEFDEYARLMEALLNKIDKFKAMHLKNFKKYDVDDSGFISFEELKKILSSPGYDMSENEIRDHFSKADKNSDGKISFTEFVKYFCEA